MLKQLWEDYKTTMKMSDEDCKILYNLSKEDCLKNIEKLIDEKLK